MDLGLVGRPCQDALTLGARLKAEEAALSQERIASVLAQNTYTFAGEPSWFSQQMREELAMVLYNAYYRDTGVEPAEPEEVLETLCGRIFGATFSEVLEAYDRFLR